MSRSDQIEGFCHGFVTVEGYLALSGGVLEFRKIRKWFRINRATSVGRLAQLVRAPALQVATSPLLLSLSPFFSIALHSFRDSAFAQHITLFGCLTCISDTFSAQQEVHESDCRGQMLCLKIASEGDCYSHSWAEALVCDYQLAHASSTNASCPLQLDRHGQSENIWIQPAN